jgi:hypothetical protein
MKAFSSKLRNFQNSLQKNVEADLNDATIQFRADLMV